MHGDLWKRPSVIVVATTVAVLGTFVLRGDLTLQAPSRPVVSQSDSGPPENSGPPEKPAVVAQAPVVVKATREASPRQQAQEAAWRGRVYDTSGFFVMGAQVLAGEQVLAQSGPQGEFVCQLGGDPSPLLVQAAGYRPRWVVPSLQAPDAQVVQLIPAAPWDQADKPPEVAPALRGEGVVLAADGRPLVGAYVTAVGGEAWARTDQAGRYRLALPSQQPVLVVHQPESQGDGLGLAARSEPLELPRGAGLVPLPDLTAMPGLALRGVLRDARGVPLSGVALQIRGEGLSRTVESGMSGMFRLTGLLRGSYEVQPLGHRGQLGGRQRVMVDERVGECDIQLVATQDRRVQVVDEAGVPRPGVHVAGSWAGQRRSVAVADAEGVVAIAVAAAALVWEVREGPDFVALRVQHYDEDAGRLVVAMP